MSGRQALVCAPRMPEHDRESGSRRLFHLIEFLQEEGWAVSFAAREAAGGERYVEALQQRGVHTLTSFGPGLEDLIRVVQPDLALLAFWHVAEALLPLVRGLSPSTRIVVDSVDLHFLRNARKVHRARGEAGPPRALDTGFACEMVRELNVYAAADGVLTVSEGEAEWVNGLTGDPGLARAVPDVEELPASPLPFDRRDGILFVGNFWHAPNVDAAQYFCTEILPRLDPSLTAAHPVVVLGNGLNKTVQDLARRSPHVRVIGWVPSVVPYLQRARVTVLPLRYGAGTKRKLIQALMAGTPTVSTRVGVEGLGLVDREHVLVADEAGPFADAVSLLLTDRGRWERMAAAGREHVLGRHGREAGRSRFRQAIAEVLGRRAKSLPAGSPVGAVPSKAQGYQELVARVKQVASAILPAGVRVLVAGKGDDELLSLGGGRQGQHFPQTGEGVYAGHHPASSEEAIAHLEALRGKGSEFLLIPGTTAWWLDHYAAFREHLESCHERLWADESCTIYRLRVRGPEGPRGGVEDGGAGVDLEGLRPRPPALLDRERLTRAGPAMSVLVAGIYLADQQNTVEDVVAVLDRAEKHAVTQRWVALGGAPRAGRVAEVTVRTVTERRPKFEILNEVLAGEDLGRYDYLLVADDDIVLPHDFIDLFISLQSRLDFVLAQPARTSNSYIDHPIVEQQQGVLARQTRFVEIGPVVSFHRSCYELVLPFDLTSPMGWGYENVWAHRLARRQMKMGIIDILPVDHSLRKPVANYSWGEADAQRKELFKKHKHYSYDECFRVLAAVPIGGGDGVAGA